MAKVGIVMGKRLRYAGYGKSCRRFRETGSLIMR